MLLRTISAICTLLIFLPAFIWSDTVILVIAMSFLASRSVYEMLRCTKLLKRKAVSIPAIGLAILMPFACRLGSFFGPDLFSDGILHAPMALALVFFFTVIISLVLARKDANLHATVSTAAMCIYITVGFSSMVLLRDLDNGEYIYWLPFMTTWGSDIFAYIIGRLFGKHKLAPRVSPKKTVEGSIGGMIGNIVFVLVYILIISNFTTVNPNYPAIIIVAIVTSIISQIGDLFMSLVKRNYGIKDFGRIMPGHGGTLDRFDSLIAVAPFLYLFYTSSHFFVLF